MATPKKIQLTVNDTGIVKNKSQTNEAASKVSELLQKNHEVQFTNCFSVSLTHPN